MTRNCVADESPRIIRINLGGYDGLGM